jgi:hypothetical protein
MWFGQEGCCQKETIKENIKYVHQLQNLWFGLTGEELTREVEQLKKINENLTNGI